MNLTRHGLNTSRSLFVESVVYLVEAVEVPAGLEPSYALFPFLAGELFGDDDLVAMVVSASTDGLELIQIPFFEGPKIRSAPLMSEGTLHIAVQLSPFCFPQCFVLTLRFSPGGGFQFLLLASFSGDKMSTGLVSVPGSEAMALVFYGAKLVMAKSLSPVQRLEWMMSREKFAEAIELIGVSTHFHQRRNDPLQPVFCLIFI